MQQKKYYNSTAKPLEPLKSGDVVWIRSKDGFKKKGVIVRKAEYPRSYMYIVKSGSREYRWNRTHLLRVNETPECEEIEEPEMKQVEQPRPREETREE